MKYKLNTEYDVFEKIINAFKVNNKIIEHNRTTHKKTYNDFINCTILPENIKICFIDVLHKHMVRSINSFLYTLINNKISEIVFILV